MTNRPGLTRTECSGTKLSVSGAKLGQSWVNWDHRSPSLEVTKARESLTYDCTHLLVALGGGTCVHTQNSLLQPHTAGDSSLPATGAFEKLLPEGNYV